MTHFDFADRDDPRQLALLQMGWMIEFMRRDAALLWLRWGGGPPRTWQVLWDSPNGIWSACAGDLSHALRLTLTRAGRLDACLDELGRGERGEGGMMDEMRYS